MRRTNGEMTVTLVAMLAAGLAWGAWRAGGVALTVGAGGDVRRVGLVSVLVTAAVVGLSGAALRRLLRRRRHGRRLWLGAAGLVLLVSLLGPLGATSPSDGLALASLHLVVAAVVVVGLSRVSTERTAVPVGA